MPIQNTLLLPIVLISLTLSSCSKNKTEEPGLRAIAKWQALIEYDWKKAYSFSSPSYKENYSISEFRGSFGQAVLWKEIKHNSTKMINEQLVDVSLTLIFEYSGGSTAMDLSSKIIERWQLINNRWWYVGK